MLRFDDEDVYTSKVGLCLLKSVTLKLNRSMDSLAWTACERLDGWTNGRTDGWTNGRTDGWTNGRTDGLTDGRTDGLTDGRMD